MSDNQPRLVLLELHPISVVQAVTMATEEAVFVLGLSNTFRNFTATS